MSTASERHLHCLRTVLLESGMHDVLTETAISPVDSSYLTTCAPETSTFLSLTALRAPWHKPFTTAVQRQALCNDPCESFDTESCAASFVMVEAVESVACESLVEGDMPQFRAICPHGFINLDRSELKRWHREQPSKPQAKSVCRQSLT